MPANHNYFSGKRFTCYGWGKSFDRIELAGRRELADDQSVEKNGGKKTDHAHFGHAHFDFIRVEMIMYIMCQLLISLYTILTQW